ncbi:MAG TPA: hypothetical protein VKA85_08450 [Candidatus Limnocylindrales bacterium]|nr:hypothetical protein [Candidatus Limnocylindrales bacterium]
MPRRLLALLAVLGLLVVVAGCQGAPVAPALTDPKDILTRSVLSLKDVKTIQIKGELSGTASVPGSGSIDLKGTTLDVSADIPAKKAHVGLSAPSILGTAADVIAVDNAVYLKVTGPLAAMAGADPTGKYKKTDVSAVASSDPGNVATDPQKAIDEFKAALDKLPAPTKAADEKCGDKDCYHINIKVTDKDLAALDPTAASSLGGTPVTVNVDVWPQKDNLRPAKLGFTVDAGTMGTFTLTFTMTYDQSVSISAPSADQIAP